MAVDYVEILKIGLPLLGGGAMGAIIKTYVDKRKNRIQPIKKLVEISNLFTPEKILDDYLTKITLSGSTSVYNFDNLYIAKIEIFNIGNKDYEEFSFGITAPENVEIVNIETTTEDRHHTIESVQNVNFDNHSNIIDFVCKPFNRKNSYKIELLLTASETIENFNLEFSTSLPIKFIDASTISITSKELFKAVLQGVINGSIELKIR